MRIILSSTRKLHNQLLVLQLAHNCPYFMFLLSIYNFLSRSNLKHLSLNILDGLMMKYFLIQVALLLKVHQIKWFNDEILKGIYDELKDKSKGVYRNQVNNGSKTIPPWTIAPRTIAPWTTTPGQLPPRTITLRIIATQDNWPPDNCPRTISIQDVYPLGNSPRKFPFSWLFFVSFL